MSNIINKSLKYKCKFEEQGYCGVSNNLSVKCYPHCPIEIRVRTCDICQANIATRVERVSLDAEMGDDGDVNIIYGRIPICDDCFEDYQEGEGYWERRY